MKNRSEEDRKRIELERKAKKEEFERRLLQAIHRYKELNWAIEAISHSLGCSESTVRRLFEEKGIKIRRKGGVLYEDTASMEDEDVCKVYL